MVGLVYLSLSLSLSPGLLSYIWYSEDGTGRSCTSPLIAVSNVSAHPSTAGVPITVLLYNGPLLCGFNVPIKGLTLNGIGSSQKTELSSVSHYRPLMSPTDTVC